MKFEYEVKGVTLDIGDLINIHAYYEAACTAEYLMDNYDIANEDQALKLGYIIREHMDKYGYDEMEAIYEVMKRRNR